MRVYMLNPIPWSAVRQHDGSLAVTVSSGPREAVSLKFPTPRHLSNFVAMLSACLDTVGGAGVQPGQVWACPTLLEIAKKTQDDEPSGPRTYEPDSIPESVLRDLGLTFDPRSGWRGWLWRD